ACGDVRTVRDRGGNSGMDAGRAILDPDAVLGGRDDNAAHRHLGGVGSAAEAIVGVDPHTVLDIGNAAAGNQQGTGRRRVPDIVALAGLERVGRTAIDGIILEGAGHGALNRADEDAVPLAVTGAVKSTDIVVRDRPGRTAGVEEVVPQADPIGADGVVGDV